MIFARSLPFSTRAAYHYESRYAVLKGACWGVVTLGAVVVEKVLGGTAWHLSALGAAVPASMLVAPMLAQLGRRVSMKAVVVGANLACSLFMLLVGLPLPATLFTGVACAALVTHGPTVVAETALYKINYPDSHRSQTVGLLRMFGFGAAGVVALAAGRWLGYWPSSYRVMFPVAGLIGLVGALFYARIKVRGQEFMGMPQGSRLGLVEAAAAVRNDRRFLVYEIVTVQAPYRVRTGSSEGVRLWK